MLDPGVEVARGTILLREYAGSGQLEIGANIAGLSTGWHGFKIMEYGDQQT